MKVPTNDLCVVIFSEEGYKGVGAPDLIFDICSWMVTLSVEELSVGVFII